MRVPGGRPKNNKQIIAGCEGNYSDNKLQAPIEMAGLSFDNYQRNQYICSKGYPAPTATSTGTTIVGVKFDGGVVVSIGRVGSV